jgi:hypothetical protein
MGNRYSAFGLALCPSFPLPGMVSAEGDGLPALAIDLETPTESHAAWSGGVTSSPWRGRLGDGRDLTIEWGSAGDLRFGYGDQAWFHLDAARGRLGCAPVEVATLAWQRVLLSRIIPNVSLAHGREALHAAAVEIPLGVVAIAAPSGMGKSTLAYELVRRGHRLFTDDVLILSRGDETVHAHPGSPHMNLTNSVASSPAEFGKVLGTLSGESWISVDDASRQPSTVAAIVLLERGRGLPLAVEPLEVSPLVLAPYMLGLPDQTGRDAHNFALYSDLVDSARLLRLTGDVEHLPSDFANALEQALGLDVSAVAGGLA